MFNAQTASIEVRVSREITADWNAIKPATVVIAGRGGWQAEQDEEKFTQLYGINLEGSGERSANTAGVDDSSVLDVNAEPVEETTESAVLESMAGAQVTPLDK